VGIGTSAMGARLNVETAASAGISYPLDIRNPQNAVGTGAGAMLRIHSTSDANRGVGIASSSTTNYATDNSMLFYTSSSSTLTERMRLDSSGNLLVGKSATAFGTAGIEARSGGTLWATASETNAASFNRLSTDGAIAYFSKDSTIVGSIGVATGPVAYMVFNNTTSDNVAALKGASGAILPSTNAGADKDGTMNLGSSGARFKDLYLSGSAYAGSLFVNVTTEVAAGYIASIKCAAGTGGVIIQNSSTTGVPLSFRDTSGGGIGSVSTTNTATAYNTSSDQRLKENIADADDAGSKIDAIQVRKFDWKADGSHQDYGMIAQELQAVAPEAVTAPEDPEEMMGVDYSKLVPMMLKEIQSLRARVSELES